MYIKKLLVSVFLLFGSLVASEESTLPNAEHEIPPNFIHIVSRASPSDGSEDKSIWLERVSHYIHDNHLNDPTVIITKEHLNGLLERLGATFPEEGRAFHILPQHRFRSLHEVVSKTHTDGFCDGRQYQENSEKADRALLAGDIKEVERLLDPDSCMVYHKKLVLTEEEQEAFSAFISSGERGFEYHADGYLSSCGGRSAVLPRDSFRLTSGKVVAHAKEDDLFRRAANKLVFLTFCDGDREEKKDEIISYLNGEKLSLENAGELLFRLKYQPITLTRVNEFAHCLFNLFLIRIGYNPLWFSVRERMAIDLCCTFNITAERPVEMESRVVARLIKYLVSNNYPTTVKLPPLPILG